MSTNNEMTEQEYNEYLSYIESQAEAAFALAQNLQIDNPIPSSLLVHEFDENTPQPHPSWTLKDNGVGGKYWDAPIPMPTDGKAYFWSEESISWVEVN